MLRRQVLPGTGKSAPLELHPPRQFFTILKSGGLADRSFFSLYVMERFSFNPASLAIELVRSIGEERRTVAMICPGSYNNDRMTRYEYCSLFHTLFHDLTNPSPW